MRYLTLLLVLLLLAWPGAPAEAQVRRHAAHARRPHHRPAKRRPFQQHDSLLVAVATNNLPLARRLVRHGADVNGRITKADSVGYTGDDEYGGGHSYDMLWLPDWSCVNAADLPLSVAISCGHAAMVEFLLAHGAATRTAGGGEWGPSSEWALPLVLGYLPNQEAVLRRLLARPGMRDSTTAQDWHSALAQVIQYNYNMRNTMAQAAEARAPRAASRRLASPWSRYRVRPRRYSPLIYPLRSDSVGLRLLEMLLEAGANPCGAPSQPAPLFLAASCGEVALARYLATHGARINASEIGRRSTPLLAAVKGRDSAMVRLLLDQGADPLATDLAGNTPLHLAARAGPAVVVSMLLQAGADASCLSGKAPVNGVSDGGAVATPLCLAAAAGQVEIVQMLLKAGARPSTPNAARQTPLLLATTFCKGYYAAETAPPALATGETEENLFADDNPVVNSNRYGNYREPLEAEEKWPAPGNNAPAPAVPLSDRPRGLVLQLLALGADPTVADAHGETPLRTALKANDTTLVRALLAHGANPNHADSNGYTDVCYTRSLPALRLVLARGAQLRGSYTSPVHGSSACDVPFVQACLAAGIRVSDANEWGQTPLHSALDTKQATPEVVAFYLAHGAPVEVVNSSGYTPLALAARAGRAAPMQLLLDAKANPDGTEAHRLLVEAVQAGDAASVRALLRHGAHPTLTDGRSETALLAAARLRKPSAEVLELLLAAGADPNAADDTGTTPLLRYVAQRRQFVPSHRTTAEALARSDADFLQGACVLLAHGAKADIENKLGNSCLKELRQNGHLTVFRSLLTELGQPLLKDNNGW